MVGLPIAIPLDGMAAMIAQLRQFAKDAGRDPQSLEVIVGANISLSEKPLGADHAIFTGSEDQVKNDIEAVKKTRRRRNLLRDFSGRIDQGFAGDDGKV